MRERFQPGGSGAQTHIKALCHRESAELRGGARTTTIAQTQVQHFQAGGENDPWILRPQPASGGVGGSVGREHTGSAGEDCRAAHAIPGAADTAGGGANQRRCGADFRCIHAGSEPAGGDEEDGKTTGGGQQGGHVGRGLSGDAEQDGDRNGEEPVAEVVRAQALASEPEIEESIAAMRLVLRRDFALAEETEDVQEYLHLMDTYGKMCMRLVRVLKSEGTEQDRLKEYMRAEILKAIEEVAEELGLSVG